MSGLIGGRCDAYGAESLRPDQNLGGFDTQPVAIQHICGERAAHRFRWICAHGHCGRIVELCERHYLEFTGSREVPWNVRRHVQFCPRCNTADDHRCELTLVAVS